MARMHLLTGKLLNVKSCNALSFNVKRNDTPTSVSDTRSSAMNGMREIEGPAGHAISDLKRVYVEQTFSVSVDHMFDTIYGENNPFWKDYLGQNARGRHRDYYAVVCTCASSPSAATKFTKHS